MLYFQCLAQLGRHKGDTSAVRVVACGDVACYWNHAASGSIRLLKLDCTFSESAHLPGYICQHTALSLVSQGRNVRLSSCIHQRTKRSLSPAPWHGPFFLRLLPETTSSALRSPSLSASLRTLHQPSGAVRHGGYHRIHDALGGPSESAALLFRVGGRTVTSNFGNDSTPSIVTDSQS